MIIKHMSDFDWSDLDARLLQLLVSVVDAGSITGAAQSLGVTQSAVSHQLDKLRAITGDALFVKSGRGIVATARAGELAAQARELLRQLQAAGNCDGSNQSHPGRPSGSGTGGATGESGSGTLMSIVALRAPSASLPHTVT